MPDLYDGPTYDPALDKVRLTGQIEDVFRLMSSHHWYTVKEIAHCTGHPETSVAAQIRNLRKVDHGAWEIRRSHKDHRGLYAFRLTGNHVPPDTKLSLNAQLRQRVADLERELARCQGQGDLPL